MTHPILETHQLHKTYQARQGEISAIEDVSLSVKAGELLCLVGPSGGGKTTLLRLMAGLITPDQGWVNFAGQRLDTPCPEIGFVFQKPNLMPWRTVLNNVLLPLQIRGVSTSLAHQQAKTVLALVGLAEFEHSYPHQLSGGMQQRVSIARSLIYEPDILLLDEPFGALDALTRERLNHELLEIWQGSTKTIVMVTHDIREAVYLADRVIILSQRPGRIIDEIPINLPRPRNETLFYEPHFNALAYTVREAIK